MSKVGKNYSIFLISNKPERYPEIQQSLLPELLYYFDGSNATNFSELVNRCVASSLTETVIIVGDKCRPTHSHIQTILELLDKDYGFVGLHRFGVFGLKKELLRKVGMFDERFLGGGYEDYDFTLRLLLSNIAFYVTEDVKYLDGSTEWDYNKSLLHFIHKWIHHWDKGISEHVPAFEKAMVEEQYQYDLGPSVPTKFLPCREYSVVRGRLAERQLQPFLETTVFTSVPLEFINQPSN